MRAAAVCVVALGPLDLDDVGAEVREDLAGHRPRQRLPDLDDANAVQHHPMWGAPIWPPTPPNARSAPGNPWRSWATRALIGTLIGRASARSPCGALPRVPRRCAGYAPPGTSAPAETPWTRRTPRESARRHPPRGRAPRWNRAWRSTPPRGRPRRGRPSTRPPRSATGTRAARPPRRPASTGSPGAG